MCYCCKEKCVRISMIVINFLLIIPGVLLIIFGSGFAGDLKILGDSDSGQKLTKIGTAITYLFGAMGIYAGVIGLLVGILFTKAPKCSKICACLHNLTSLLFFFVFLVLGIVFLAISTVGIKYINKYCDGTLDTSSLPGNFKQYIGSIRQFELDLAKVPSTYLCTDLCPCPPAMNGWS